MKKGITPIISIIILLLITVALAGAAWTYMSGFLGAYTEKSFIIPTGGAYCDSAHSFHVRVVNTGTTAIRPSDWVYANVSTSAGAEAGGLSGLYPSADVAVRGSAEFTETGGTSGSAYTINIGTVAGVQHIPVVCP